MDNSDPPTKRYISDYPHLVKEWDYEKNDKQPSEVSRGSQKKYFWICPDGHSYSAQALHRTYSGSGCSICNGKVITHENSLAGQHQDIASLLHPSKNDNVDPHKIHEGSHKILWWQCKEGHEWKTSVKSLTKLSTRCPSCLPNNEVITFSPTFQSQFPNLAAMWDEETNGMALSSERATTTSRYFHFKCTEGHKFRVYTPDLIYGINDDCAECVQMRLTEHRKATIEAMGLEQQLKSKKQKHELYFGSTKQKLNWLCENGHEWSRQLKQILRAGRNDCPKCKNYHVTGDYNWAAANPDPTLEFPMSHTVATFKCKFGHVWTSPLKRRTQGHGCPKCSNQTSRPELRIFSELKKVFHKIRHRKKIEGREADICIDDFKIIIEFDGGYYHDGKEDSDLSKKRFFESLGYSVINVRQALPPLDADSVCIPDRDLNKHDLNEITSRLIDNLPACDERALATEYQELTTFWNDEFYNMCVSALPAPLIENSLASVAPTVASDWDYEANYPLTPEHFWSRSSQKVSWRCRDGHEWEATIAARVGSGNQKGTGCPYCSGNKASNDNNLAKSHPELLKEWDYEKNEKDAVDFTTGSKQVVSWICNECKNPFDMQIVLRTKRGSGCPQCTANKHGKKTKIPLSTSHPHIFSLIDWDKSEADKNTVTKGSGKKALVKCGCGHEFERIVGNLTAPVSRCPSCGTNLNDPVGKL
jgi:hypothetical protein